MARTARYERQDVQERAREQHEAERALREVRHALLDDGDRHLRPARVVVCIVVVLLFVGAGFLVCVRRRQRRARRRASAACWRARRRGPAQTVGPLPFFRVAMLSISPPRLSPQPLGIRPAADRPSAHDKTLRMDRRLRDEPVRRGHAEQAREEGRDAEQEEVPVEAGRLAEREGCALRVRVSGAKEGGGQRRARTCAMSDDTLWSKKKRTHSTAPNGNATPTQCAGSSQKRTSHSRPPAGRNAREVGSVGGSDRLSRPQYAHALVATSASGRP
jgi:hypothetical protein